jgi:WhiB family transcriptional regulator, redox-sensing transcriptional regulator
MTVHTNWRDDGACRDADPDLFFPIGTTGNAIREIDEAKRICSVCRVQIQCLAWALENGVTDGVWGGTTEDERRVIRSLSRRKTISKEDDNDKIYHPAERGEDGIRAQAAQSKATRILRRAGIDPDAGGTGAMAISDAARHQRHHGS